MGIISFESYQKMENRAKDAEVRVRELEEKLCIAYDYLAPKYEMDSAPLHLIKQEVEYILKK